MLFWHKAVLVPRSVGDRETREEGGEREREERAKKSVHFWVRRLVRFGT